jgi:hypothetical protein
MAFPNVSDIITTTLEKRSKKIADNVTASNAGLTQMQKKGRVRTVSGGRLIYEALSFAANGNGGWYSGYDTLSTAAQDVITSAEYAWKQYAVPVVISGLEMGQNSGEEALIDLLDARITVAESTMANAIATAFYADGTGSGGKTLGGLDLLVPQDPTTGTAGAINRATYTFWRSQLLDPASTPTASTIQGYMNSLWISCTRGSDMPDIIIAGSTIGATFEASLQAIQRVTDPGSATAGFNSYKYKSADVVIDNTSGTVATDMYFLNTKYLSFRPHADRNMVPLSPEKRFATNQDASVSILGFMGNFTMSNGALQGRLKGD